MEDNTTDCASSNNASAIPEAGAVIARLADVWDEIAARTETGHGRFIDEIFGRIWKDGDTGEKFEAEIDTWDEQPEEIRPLGLLQAILVSCAYAAQAMKAEKAGDLFKSWRQVSRAKYWLGIVIGTWAMKQDMPEGISSIAKRAADIRHAENRAMKAQVLSWYAENASKFGSKDDAAIEATSLVPLKFRTVRDWLKEGKK